MIRRIERIEYRHGMLDDGAEPDALPVRTWRGNDLPEELRSAVFDEGILELGGVYGDPDVGDPVQYDHLKIFLDDEVVHIEFFNRAIALLFADEERFRQIHRVLCKLGSWP